MRVWLCGREDELGGNGGGCGGMCVSGRPGGRGGEGFRPMAWRRPQPPLDVELCDRPLSARVRVLAVDALAVAFHLGQVLVEDFAWPQCRHKVIELAAVVLAVRLCFAGLAFPFPLLFELREGGGTKMELEFLLQSAFSDEKFNSCKHCSDGWFQIIIRLISEVI